MTTYELPPEPPIGSKVHPTQHPDVVWRHNDDKRWFATGRAWCSWAQLLGEYEDQGLTLIEPDPWPTAPLIVASVDGGGPQLLSVLTTHSAATMTSAIVRRSESALTNVVPVTVVPVAALPVLWSALEQWLNGNSDPGSDTNRLVGAVINLREQIDALGVDL